MKTLFHPREGAHMSLKQDVVRPDPPFLIRTIYFIFIGWWLSLLWINAAWALNAIIIGLPLGLWMINRTAQILTLKAAPVLVVHTEDGQLVHLSNLPQLGCLVRALYFILVGSWFSLIWANVGWFLCITIIGLPFGIWMLNRLPMMTTLYQQ
jgi:uncharacterized membrane protein YccF (DUF307 family)